MSWQLILWMTALNLIHWLVIRQYFLLIFYQFILLIVISWSLRRTVMRLFTLVEGRITELEFQIILIDFIFNSYPLTPFKENAARHYRLLGFNLLRQEGCVVISARNLWIHTLHMVSSVTNIDIVVKRNDL